jgi:hypothetical protein
MARINHEDEAKTALAEAESLGWEDRERSDRLVAAATAHALLALIEEVRSIAVNIR